MAITNIFTRHQNHRVFFLVLFFFKSVIALIISSMNTWFSQGAVDFLYLLKMETTLCDNKVSLSKHTHTHTHTHTDTKKGCMRRNPWETWTTYYCDNKQCNENPEGPSVKHQSVDDVHWSFDRRILPWRPAGVCLILSFWCQTDFLVNRLSSHLSCGRCYCTAPFPLFYILSRNSLVLPKAV